MMNPADARLPVLRPDIEMHTGPAERDGSPTITLHDPTTRKFYKVGWSEGVLLELMKSCRTLGDLMQRMRAQTTLSISEEEVSFFCKQMVLMGLTTSSAVAPVPQLMQQKRKGKMNPFSWILMHGLFFRIPLVHPDRFLARTVDRVRFLGSCWAFTVVGFCYLFGILILIQRFDSYINNFPRFFTVQGVVAYAAAIAGVKIIHELAHAYTARALGVRVPTMGVNFIALWPILFCDVTDAWRLPRRRDRLAITLAGVLSEIMIAGVTLFLWGVLPPGILRSICFVLSSTAVISTILVNLNPGMRFDGYYALMDIWGIDNLRPRAFAMTKWALRRFFLKADLAPPERAEPLRLACMMIYSIYAWIYRVGLYVGIALTVYLKFTRVIGLFFFLAEITWFILTPAVREIEELRAMRSRLSINPRSVATLIGLVLLLGWFSLPLPRSAEIPAIALPQPQTSQFIYAPSSGRIIKITGERSRAVKKGEVLLSIDSDKLRRDWEIITLEVSLLQKEIDMLLASGEKAKPLLPAKRETLQRARQKLEETEQAIAQNHITARVDGVLVEWDETLREGMYIKAHTILGRIADPGQMRIRAYVPETLMKDVKPGFEATYHPSSDTEGVAAVLGEAETSRVQFLEHPSLSSRYGGDLATTMLPTGQLKVVDTYFPMDVRLKAPASLRISQRGSVRIRTRPRSHLMTFLRHMHQVLMRETNL